MLKDQAADVYVSASIETGYGSEVPLIRSQLRVITVLQIKRERGKQEMKELTI